MGAGLAFACKFQAPPGGPSPVAMAAFGDGAANQGQIWEVPSLSQRPNSPVSLFFHCAAAHAWWREGAVSSVSLSLSLSFHTTRPSTGWHVSCSLAPPLGCCRWPVRRPGSPAPPPPPFPSLNRSTHPFLSLLCLCRNPARPGRQHGEPLEAAAHPVHREQPVRHGHLSGPAQQQHVVLHYGEHDPGHENGREQRAGGAGGHEGSQGLLRQRQRAHVRRVRHVPVPRPQHVRPGHRLPQPRRGRPSHKTRGGGIIAAAATAATAAGIIAAAATASQHRRSTTVTSSTSSSTNTTTTTATSTTTTTSSTTTTTTTTSTSSSLGRCSALSTLDTDPRPLTTATAALLSGSAALCLAPDGPQVVEQRQSRDPIEYVRKLILDHSFMTEKELKELDKHIKKEVRCPPCSSRLHGCSGLPHFFLCVLRVHLRPAFHSWWHLACAGRGPDIPPRLPPLHFSPSLPLPPFSRHLSRPLSPSAAARSTRRRSGPTPGRCPRPRSSTPTFTPTARVAPRRPLTSACPTPPSPSAPTPLSTEWRVAHRGGVCCWRRTTKRRATLLSIKEGPG